MKRAEKQLHLVKVAADLFNRYGYHAVGIDQIIEQAGVAKTTLYRHFKSKEDLIVAVLRMVDEQTRDAMRQASDVPEGTSALLTTFDLLEGWFRSADFCGCPFMGAAKEYCDSRSPIHREAALHKRLMLAFFEELARIEGLTAPKSVADEINLLHEGAIAVAQISGDAGAARKAKAAAAKLIAEHRPASRKSRR